MAKTTANLTDIKVLTDSQYNSESKKDSILYATPIDVFYNSHINITGESGYARASNGLIIQWGAGKTNREITYPIAFTHDSSYSICWNLSDSDADHFNITNKTATGCVPGCDYWDRNCTWIAIGC